jgi:hypothetical protein
MPAVAAHPNRGFRIAPGSAVAAVLLRRLSPVQHQAETIAFLTSVLDEVADLFPASTSIWAATKPPRSSGELAPVQAPCAPWGDGRDANAAGS